MSKDSNNKTNSSQLESVVNEIYELLPESSPAFLFCQKKSEINILDENGWSPIYRAIISNNIEALKDLLKFGGDPNLCNNIGESPIYLCVDMDNFESFNILMNNNPKPDCNIQKRNGDTVLHLSIKKSKLNFTKILLENNADPNIINKLYSQTPTHLAFINKIYDENVLVKLNENNADIYNLKDKYDKTPYDYALDHKDENYIKLIKKIFGEKKERHSLYNTIYDDIDIKVHRRESTSVEILIAVFLSSWLFRSFSFIRLPLTVLR